MLVLWSVVTWTPAAAAAAAAASAVDTENLLWLVSGDVT